MLWLRRRQDAREVMKELGAWKYRIFQNNLGLAEESILKMRLFDRDSIFV